MTDVVPTTDQGINNMITDVTMDRTTDMMMDRVTDMIMDMAMAEATAKKL
jgi:hypothetical protein